MLSIKSKPIDVISVRREDLAEKIGQIYHDLGNLVPGKSFSLAHYDTTQVWTTETLQEIVWWSVAKQLERAGGNNETIDHAWLVHPDGAPETTWALVTEPYVTYADACHIAKEASRNISKWGVVIEALPGEVGAWNPPSCVPIVATFLPGYAHTLFRKALRWALNGPLR